jgi:vacuolar-type H+-ATPase subunit E/Vma4
MAESKQRSRLLSARDEYVQKLHAEAKSRLSVVASTNAQAYTVLLKGLIKQAIVSLEGETAVVVQCRPQDLAVAQKAGAAAAAEVAAEAKAAGGSRTVAVSVAADTALAGSAGGVNVTGAAGRIKCSNTLEARVDLAFGDLTPVVRDLLYPSARAPQLVKPPINFPHQNAHVHAPAPAPAPAVKAVVHAPKAAAPASHPMLDPDGVFAAASASTTVKAVEPAAGSATATDPFGF